MTLDQRILIRGAGEMATGTGVRLFRAGFRVVYTEIENPLCVRRAVSFCSALDTGSFEVEGCPAVLAQGPGEVEAAWDRGKMAVIVDPEMSILSYLKPEVIVDAVLAKKNLGLRADMAELVIAMGPGFTAGRDADIVLETNRGHNLGRLIFEGEADPNTGVPGDIAGQNIRRVLRSPGDGVWETDLEIGRMVRAGQEIARVGESAVTSGLDGVLRGLIKPGTVVHKGLKVGDVDPRGRRDFCYTISDKARAIGGSVLEAILWRYNR